MVNQYYRRLNRSVSFALLLFTGLSIVTAVIQVFMYGFSLNNIAIAVGAALFYVFALRDLNREVARSRKLEIERYKKNGKESTSFSSGPISGCMTAKVC